MERSVKDRSLLELFCQAFCKIVEKHIKYIVVSGYVAIASGRVRGTEDIDMIVPRISLPVFSKLHDDLVKNNFVCVQSSSPSEIKNLIRKLRLSE